MGRGEVERNKKGQQKTRTNQGNCPFRVSENSQLLIDGRDMIKLKSN